MRQILQHTSGIARDATNPKAKQDGTFALAELVRAGLTNAPQFAPGTSWGYSNVNYYLAGMLIERLSGQDVATATTTRIINPLGLGDTSYPAPGDRSLPAPSCRVMWAAGVGPFFFWYDKTSSMEMSAVASAGAITSTLTDLATFERALADGKLVSAETLGEMREIVPVPAP